MCKVTCTTTCAIPACSEAIIEADVEGVTDAGEDKMIPVREVLIEPTLRFRTTKQLVMASSFVTVCLQKGCTVKVRLMNPFKRKMAIHKGEVIRLMEDISTDELILFMTTKDPQEGDNYSTVRRIFRNMILKYNIIPGRNMGMQMACPDNVSVK